MREQCTLQCCTGIGKHEVSACIHCMSLVEASRLTLKGLNAYRNALREVFRQAIPF